MELKDVVFSLKTIRTEHNLNFSDKTLIEQAVKIFVTGEINEKDSKSNKTSSNTKPTEKQLKFLYNANVDFNAETITRKEASQLIDKVMKEKNG